MINTNLEKIIEEKLLDYSNINKSEYFILSKASKHKKDNTVNICPSELNKGKDFIYYDIETDTFYSLENNKDIIETNYDSKKTSTGAFFYKIPISAFTKIEKSKKKQNSKEKNTKEIEEKEKKEVSEKKSIPLDTEIIKQDGKKTIDVNKYIGSLPISKTYHIDNILKLIGITCNKNDINIEQLPYIVESVSDAYILILNKVTSI